MINNTIQTAVKPKFSVAIQSDMYKNLINNTLHDPKRAANFIASVSSAVATNPSLQECEAGTILSAALLGESLNLSPSPQLGQYYMVPYNDNKAGVKNAQFQLGYKGYVQLAIRSGQYKRLNVIPLKEGELISYDPFTEEIEVAISESPDRESMVTIGYAAMFEYLNGFRKVLYWSKAKMIAHADKYSKAFSASATAGRYPKVSYEDYLSGKYNKNDEWLYSSFWYKNFDDMACKTMLRQIISRWGIMSVEMQKAYVSDMGVIDESGKVSYVDNAEPQTYAEKTEDAEKTPEITKENAEKTPENEFFQ